MSTSEIPTRLDGGQTHDAECAPVRLLCVEDNDGDFILVREHLKDAEFSTAIELDRARSVSEAVRRFETCEPYDVVLMDLTLPDSAGAETYHRLRAAAPRVAVAILSGNSDQTLAFELVQHGAQDYLPKDTLTPDILIRCIIYAMKRQRHLVEMEGLTERLRCTAEELMATQMQLIHAEKIESMGRLSSSIAHEVKNPLGVIQMGVDFLTGRLTETGDDITTTLELMRDAVRRAESVIHDMLDFSRSDDRRTESCDVNDIMRCVVRMLKHEIDRRKIKLRLELATAPPLTFCDPRGMEQVLINIVMNSLQAMERDRTLTLRTRLASGVNAHDSSVVIEVQDEGTGIPDDIMARIFEPFFTTKPTGEGTGLGLPVCKRIIELHHGELRVANVESPRGVLVSIVLSTQPAADS